MPGNLIRHPIFGFDAPADPHRWVYHYTSLPSAVAIANSGTFRFNTLARMNDPREFKKLVLPVMSRGRPLTRNQLREVQLLTNQRRLGIRVGAFTRDEAAGTGSTLVRTDARGYARPMMWTHYANVHRGVCLVLDRAGLEAALRSKFGANLLVGDVSYTSLTSRPAWTPTLDADEIHTHGTTVAAERFFEANKRELLFIKNQDWSVEREWRVAIDRQPPGVVDVSIGTGVVAGLVVGLGVTKGRLSAVRDVATTFGIADHVARAYLHQVNVLDVLPVNTSGPNWCDYTTAELHSLGYLEA